MDGHPLKDYVLLHRRLLNWALWQDHDCVRLFITMMLMASETQKTVVHRGASLDLEPGQVPTSFRELSENSAMSIKRVRLAMDKLIEEGAVRARKWAQKGTVITLCHWQLYQLLETNFGHENGHKDETPQKEEPTGCSPLFICRDVSEAFLSEGEVATIRESLGQDAGRAIADYSARTRKQFHPSRPNRGNLVKLIIEAADGRQRKTKPTRKRDADISVDDLFTLAAKAKIERGE